MLLNLHKNKISIIIVIVLIVIILGFNVIYNKTRENFAVLDDIQDLATYNVQALLNSTNQVKFVNSSIGDNYIGIAGGNTLTDIFNDIYGKIKNSDNKISMLQTNMDNLDSNMSNTTVIVSGAVNLAQQTQDSLTSLNTNIQRIDDVSNIANSNAQQALSNSNQAIANILPIGTIVAWYSLIIPIGWSICDGNNGTPNLLGRFILGSRGDITNNGGASSITIGANNLPRHIHQTYKETNWESNCNGANCYGTATQLRNNVYYNGEINISNLFKPAVNGNYIANIKFNDLPSGFSNEGGTVKINTDSAYGNASGNADPINIMPPYHTLIYIMKTSDIIKTNVITGKVSTGVSTGSTPTTTRL